MIVNETSGVGEGRPDWFRDVAEEAPAAVLKGVDLHGVCLFPAVAMPNRRSGEWLHNGICDLVEESGRLKRTPFRPYIDELRRWRRHLDRVTELDEDPSSDPVDLADIEVAAERKGPTSERLAQVMSATASGTLGFR